MSPFKRSVQKEQRPLAGDDALIQQIERSQRLQAAAAEGEKAVVEATGDQRVVSVAVITAGITGVLAVLGASADGLEMLKPLEIDWVLTTGAVIVAAISLVLFVVFRVTRLSKQETERLRKAFTVVLDAVNEEIGKSRRAR
jgi:cytochrome c biogenesis protein CcdA